jgi:hypothetical protein
MATHPRTSRSNSLVFHASSEQLFKNILEAHLRREWNQVHASPTAYSSSETDSDPQTTWLVLFEGFYPLQQQKLGPQAIKPQSNPLW